jgi:hypothetical protein
MKAEHRKILYRNYSGLLEKINEILDEIDPVGIVASVRYVGWEADNEYSPDSEVLLLKLFRCDHPEQFESKVRNTLIEYIQHASLTEVECKLISLKTWNAWLKFQGKEPVSVPGNLKARKWDSPVIIKV